MTRLRAWLPIALLAAPLAVAEIVEESDVDARRLRALRYSLDEWREAATVIRDRGLRLRAMFIPDALAYKAAATYLELRARGQNHAAAVAAIAELLPRWKRFEDRALIELELVNEGFDRGGGRRRLFTLEENLEKKGFSVSLDGKTPVEFELSGLPSGLRLANLRIKKFWTTADGATRRVERDPDDPASIGRKPLLSKPFASLVLEDRKAGVELLVPKAPIAARDVDPALTVELGPWKLYDGPFIDDTLDLNDRRPWDEIDGVQVTARAPPAGMVVPRAVGELVAEARKRADGN